MTEQMFYCGEAKRAMNNGAASAVRLSSSLPFASQMDIGPLGNDYRTHCPAPWQPLMAWAFSFPSENSATHEGEEAFSRPQSEQGERKSSLLGTEVSTLLFLSLHLISHVGAI